MASASRSSVRSQRRSYIRNSAKRPSTPTARRPTSRCLSWRRRSHKYTPAALAPKRARVAVGEKFSVIGYGVTAPRDNRTPRCCAVPTLSPPASRAMCSCVCLIRQRVAKRRDWRLHRRLGRPGLRRRDGKRLVYGIVSWSTAPKMDDGCGGDSPASPRSSFI